MKISGLFMSLLVLMTVYSVVSLKGSESLRSRLTVRRNQLKKETSESQKVSCSSYRTCSTCSTLSSCCWSGKTCVTAGTTSCVQSCSSTVVATSPPPTSPPVVATSPPPTSAPPTSAPPTQAPTSPPAVTTVQTSAVCGNYYDCTSCANTPGCGYCASTCSCVPGTASAGPSSTCPPNFFGTIQLHCQSHQHPDDLWYQLSHCSFSCSCNNASRCGGTFIASDPRTNSSTNNCTNPGTNPGTDPGTHPGTSIDIALALESILSVTGYQ